MASLADNFNEEKVKHVEQNIELSDININLDPNTNNVYIESDDDIHTDDEEQPLLQNSTFEEDMKNDDTSSDSEDEELKGTILRQIEKKIQELEEKKNSDENKEINLEKLRNNLKKVKIKKKLFRKISRILFEPLMEEFYQIIHDTDIYSIKKFYLKLIEKVWNKIPIQWKHNPNTKNEIFESFEDFKLYCELKEIEEIQLILIFIDCVRKSNDKIFDHMEKNNKILISKLMVWGVAGEGKTTILKILACVLNIINPTGEFLNHLVINDHDTGTTEVTSIPDFYIGNLKVTAMDVPGCQDVNEVCTVPKILQQLKKKKGDIDSILFVCNINNSRLSQDQAFTFEHLAFAFKDIGPKIWEKVIIIFSQANAFENVNYTLDSYNPVCDEGNDLEGDEKIEYDKEYCSHALDYLRKQNKSLLERKKIRLSNIKNHFKTLFDNKKIYGDLDYTDEQVSDVFKKIKIVWGGFIKQRNSNNQYDFNNSKVLPIPHKMGLIPYGIDKTSNEFKTLKQQMNTNLMIEKNWVHTLTNAIIARAGDNFRLNCNMINVKNFMDKENKKNESETKNDKKNMGSGFKFDEEAKKATGKSAKKTMKEINDRDPNWLYKNLAAGIGGAALGGGVTGGLILGGIIASGPVGWIAAGGAVAGAVVVVGIYNFFSWLFG